MNIVIDTNVLLSALLSPDKKASIILDKILNKSLTLCYNNEILEEYKAVLSRKKFNIKRNDIGSLISFIRINCVNVFISSKSTIEFSDESDRVFYDVAMSIDAILITGNLKDFPKNKHIMSINDFYKHYIK